MVTHAHHRMTKKILLAQSRQFYDSSGKVVGRARAEK